jgi:hypothetical protein
MRPIMGVLGDLSKELIAYGKRLSVKIIFPDPPSGSTWNKGESGGLSIEVTNSGRIPVKNVNVLLEATEFSAIGHDLPEPEYGNSIAYPSPGDVSPGRSFSFADRSGGTINPNICRTIESGGTILFWAGESTDGAVKPVLTASISTFNAVFYGVEFQGISGKNAKTDTVSIEIQPAA